MTTTMTPNTTRELRYREAINEALRQEMERDETVIIMGEEIAGGAGREHLGIVDAWGGHSARPWDSSSSLGTSGCWTRPSPRRPLSARPSVLRLRECEPWLS